MKTNTSPSLLRAQWIEDASDELRKLFKLKGHEVPATVRTSIGWPKGSHGGKRAIGQCWSVDASSDKHNEIFLSPELGHGGKSTVAGSVRMLGVLAHEFGHAVAGHKAGHRKPFQIVADAIGLEPPWTATSEGADFDRWARGAIERIGKFPAGALSLAERKKQGTRLLKCECPECDYVVRVTRKWIDAAGPPVCPTDKVSFVCEAEDEGDED